MRLMKAGGTRAVKRVLVVLVAVMMVQVLLLRIAMMLRVCWVRHNWPVAAAYLTIACLCH